MKRMKGNAAAGFKVKKGTFGKLMKYLLHYYKGRVALVALCIIVNSAASIVASVFLQQLIDGVIVPGLGFGFDAVWKPLVTLILQMSAIYLIGLIAATAYTQIMAGVTQGTLYHFRQDMFSGMESLPIRYFDTHAHGDIMSTYTNDTDAMRQLVGQSLPQVLSATVTILVSVGTMLYYSVWLTLLTFAVLGLMFFVTGKIGGNSARFMGAQQRSLAKQEGFIEEMVKGQKVVKVFCHEEKAEKDFDELNDQLFHDSEKAHIFGNVLAPILGNIGNILYVLVAFVGILLVKLGATNVGLRGTEQITIGVIVTFLSLARQLSQTVNQVSQQVSMVAMGLAGASRIFDLMEQAPEDDNGYVTLVNARFDEAGNLTESAERTGLWAWKHYHKADDTTTYTELKGNIQMDHVDFGYVPEKTVLHDVTIDAKSGQKIAFVGATGAGKTTITNLINRFYDIQDGKIRYDGINVNKIKKADLRRSLGIVLQDTNLFTGTVMDNIRYGKLDASDEDCIKAAKLANAHGFISRLPEGYQTMLTDNGSNLSQGQRQLISIARAAVADTPAMILDEATSSIDTRTEALVQTGMDRLMKGRTVFVIAHRLSTVRNSDVIMVLDHGHVIEQGAHDELIAKKGTYYQLYTGAFELD